MTLEQQVADLVTATTNLTSVVNTELNNVRQENATFKSSIVDAQGQGVFDGGIKIGRGLGQDISNLAVGRNVLTFNTLSPGTEIKNTGIGNGALFSNTTGIANTALGNVSLYSNTTGIENTAVGYNTLSGATTGSANTIVGSNSGGSLTTGYWNTGVGTQCLAALVGGFKNTATGMHALLSATTTSESVAVGFSISKILYNSKSKYFSWSKYPYE